MKNPLTALLCFTIIAAGSACAGSVIAARGSANDEKPRLETRGVQPKVQFSFERGGQIARTPSWR